MSEQLPSADPRSRLVRLFGQVVVAAVIGVIIWGVLSLGGEMFGTARHIRCQSNLRTIIQGFSLYRTQNQNQLPDHLAQILPLIDNQRGRLICPSDPNRGRNGCRPQWLRRGDQDLFANVDLDGPTLNPELDSDSVPASYLYAANGYPCGLVGFQRTWRQEFDRLVAEFGKDVPIIRCYYHLPESYAPADGPQRPDELVPDPAATPTYNVTANLELKQYTLDWHAQPGFSGPR